MMTKQLKDFTSWLSSDLTHFVALIEEGSTVTGDPWQEGYSDYDITIVVSQDEESEMDAVYQWLQKNPLPDTYLFGPRLAQEFLRGSSINDLSLKFRSKTIHGRDLVAEKQEPNQEVAFELGSAGLRNLEIRFKRRKLNLAHWSIEHCQKENYPIFKDFFVLAAAKLYGETGKYPTARTDVREALRSEFDVTPILAVVNNIEDSTKEMQFAAFEVGIQYLQTL